MFFSVHILNTLRFYKHNITTKDGQRMSGLCLFLQFISRIALQNKKKSVLNINTRYVVCIFANTKLYQLTELKCNQQYTNDFVLCTRRYYRELSKWNIFKHNRNSRCSSYDKFSFFFLPLYPHWVYYGGSSYWPPLMRVT